jgi:amino acid permease
MHQYFVASLAIFLNFLTFITALPEMFKTTQDEARDFSAYYITVELSLEIILFILNRKPTSICLLFYL